MNAEKDVLRHRLNLLILWRPLCVIPLLGLFLLLNFDALQKTPDIYIFYALMGATGFLTVLYAAAAQGIQNPNALIIVQLAGDLLAITLLTGITGNVESPFSILYIANIVLSALFFHQKGGVLVATTALLLLGAVVVIEKIFIPSFTEPLTGHIQWALPSQAMLYRLFLHLLAFYAIGIFSGRFFHRMHQEKTGFARLRRLHEDIVRNIPSGLVTTDLNGRITSFNGAASQIMGIPPEEAMGAIWWELMQWPELQRQHQNLARYGTPQRFEGSLSKRNGEPCVIGVTLSSLHNDQGETTGMIGIFQDLTNIKRIEEEMHQKRRLAAIGEVAAGMAHEIRNPLAAISGSVQLLQKELVLRGEHRRLMEIALDETQRLNNVITEFILYARPLPPHRKWIALADLLGEGVGLLKNANGVAGRVHVQLVLPADPIPVFVDPDQIKQVFWNLAVNAFQAMPAGGRLTISVSCRPEQDENRIEICFCDTGIGIPESNLPKIFDPFFTTKSSGSGLGLPIVQRIVEQHAGTLEVESMATGTTFRVILPQGDVERIPVEKSVA